MRPFFIRQQFLPSEVLLLHSLSEDALTGLQSFPALELVFLDNNKCTCLEGVQQCPGLWSLHADQNRLLTLPELPLRHLRYLSLASNR